MAKIGKYNVGVILGEGTFCIVREGTHETTGEKVALKILKKDKLNDLTKQQIANEVLALQKIDHPNVIKMKDVFYGIEYAMDGEKFDALVIVLELATGGELFEFLSFTGAFEESVARTYFNQMINALETCHIKEIAHRDLKPENMLLDGQFQLKICDFGLSKVYEKGNALMYTSCGTSLYQGPEVAKGKGLVPYDSQKSDIWSTGVILFVMLAGFPPFQSPTTKDWWFNKLHTGKHSLFWQAHSKYAYFSEKAQDLLNKILHTDPKKRMTIEEIKEHPWCQETNLSQKEILTEFVSRKADLEEQKSQELANGDVLVRDLEELGDDELPTFNPTFSMNLINMEKTSSKTLLSSDSSKSLNTLVVEEKVEPLDYAPLVKKYTVFKSKNTPTKTLKNLEKVFGKLGGQVTTVQKDIYKLKAKVITRAGLIKCSAQVFKGDNEGECLVEINRLSGSFMDFNKYFKLLRNKMDKVKQFTSVEEVLNIKKKVKND